MSSHHPLPLRPSSSQPPSQPIIHPPPPLSIEEPGSCTHFPTSQDPSRKDMTKRFRKLMGWSLGMDMLPLSSLKKRKPTYPTCTSCHSSLHRPTVCLTCEQPFCRPVPQLVAAGNGGSSGSRAPTGIPNGHGSNNGNGKGKMKLVGCMMDHVKATSHHFTLDTSTGSIHCNICSDTIYPEGFQVVYARSKRLAEDRMDDSSFSRHLHSTKREGEMEMEDGREMKKVKFRNWKSSEEGDGLMSRMEKVKCHVIRPLLNLSQTCFLSAILQAFLHNPLLRSYYLSDKHNRLRCEYSRRSNSKSNGNGNVEGTGQWDDPMAVDEREGSEVGSSFGGGGNGIGNGMGECFVCEMDTVFNEAYGEDSTPYAPVALLYAMWKASTELAGHAQQDAHTLYLAALNQIHAHSPESETSETPQDCRCIAHQAFSGALLSTVTCTRCQESTQTIEPLLDLNLELKAGPLTNNSKKSASAAQAISEAGSVVSGGSGPLTLADCLRRYTAKEALSDKAYKCGKCRDDTAGAIKQLSIKKLPSTIAIQFKRFEHTANSTSKVETMVKFPTELDMRPYMSDVLHQTKGKVNELPSEMYKYQLSTVVTHEGKLDNGHYWADVKSGYEWFHCDDEKISTTPLSSVLAQKAYMLFYVKSSLMYEQAEDQAS